MYPVCDERDAEQDHQGRSALKWVHYQQQAAYAAEYPENEDAPPIYKTEQFRIVRGLDLHRAVDKDEHADDDRHQGGNIAGMQNDDDARGHGEDTQREVKLKRKAKQVV